MKRDLCEVLYKVSCYVSNPFTPVHPRFLDTVYSCMNMLLQVQRRDGEWIDADPIPNTVLVNIADMMQRWTSDKLISAVYTIIMNNNNVQKVFYIINRQVTKSFYSITYPAFWRAGTPARAQTFSTSDTIRYDSREFNVDSSKAEYSA